MVEAFEALLFLYLSGEIKIEVENVNKLLTVDFDTLQMDYQEI